MTIDELELYDEDVASDILSHLPESESKVIEKILSRLCGEIAIRDTYIMELRIKMGEAITVLKREIPKHKKPVSRSLGESFSNKDLTTY